ncbi:hypothetical protein AB0L24_37975, partial [Streptomyces achromogenes]
MTAFVVRRFVDRSLLVDLSVTPDGTLHHPDQVAEICRPEDLADLVTADTPARSCRQMSRPHQQRCEGDGCLVGLGGLVVAGG